MTDEPHLPNIAEFTVSEITASIKRQLEGEFARIRVRGEISGTKLYPSGHCYFSLKDQSAVLSGVCWQGVYSRLACRPEDGNEVVITGRITVGTRSQYQLIVEQIELAGVGAILKMIEDRKKKLDAEGLFLADRKKPLPYMPRIIGVVTSPAGAVIRDILHRIRDRCPCHVIVWPTAVQGAGAAEQIAAAITGFNNLAVGGVVERPDLLIVARGGGSIEDLMPFNEEIVVRAAAASKIPLISAVGHETDWTLIDYAADQRAPTPTGAAEMAVPVRSELTLRVQREGAQLHQIINTHLQQRSRLLEREGRTLADPGRLLERAMQQFDYCLDGWTRVRLTFFSERLQRIQLLTSALKTPREQLLIAQNKLAQTAEKLVAIVGQNWAVKTHQLERWAHVLQSYSYRHVLERGFVLVRGKDGAAVTRAKSVTRGDELVLQFYDGEYEVQAGKKQGRLL